MKTVLWFGDHLLNEPLIGRQFIPNVMDCYELMRTYVHQTHNRQLPAVPRPRSLVQTRFEE